MPTCRVALVEELYVRRELFPGQEPAFMDVSEDEVLVMAEHLAGGIQIPTISYEEGNFEEEALVDINEYIEGTYPNLHSDSHVAWEIVHNYRGVKSHAENRLLLRVSTLKTRNLTNYRIVGQCLNQSSNFQSAVPDRRHFGFVEGLLAVRTPRRRSAR